LGPRKPSTSPRSASNDIPSTATIDPNLRRRSLALIISSPLKPIPESYPSVLKTFIIRLTLHYCPHNYHKFFLFVNTQLLNFEQVRHGCPECLKLDKDLLTNCNTQTDSVYTTQSKPSSLTGGFDMGNTELRKAPLSMRSVRRSLRICDVCFLMVSRLFGAEPKPDIVPKKKT